MTETRRKGLERKRLRDESTSTSIPAVNEDKRKFSLFLHPRHITQERVRGSYRRCNPGARGGTCA